MGTQITTKSAASHLGVSEQRIRTLCREERLAATKHGQSWLIEQDSLDKYGLQTGHTLVKNHAAQKKSHQKTDKPLALSFFSGAMGLDLGVEKAGFEVRLACEFDKFCFLGELVAWLGSTHHAGVVDSQILSLVRGGLLLVSTSINRELDQGILHVLEYKLFMNSFC